MFYFLFLFLCAQAGVQQKQQQQQHEDWAQKQQHRYWSTCLGAQLAPELGGCTKMCSELYENMAKGSALQCCLTIVFFTEISPKEKKSNNFAQLSKIERLLDRPKKVLSLINASHLARSRVGSAASLSPIAAVWHFFTPQIGLAMPQEKVRPLLTLFSQLAVD